MPVENEAKEDKEEKIINKIVFHSVIIKKYPDFIPQQIREDYEEACGVLDISPKASATLARRCLQGIIRDFYKINKYRLYDEIEELRGYVSSDVWKAIDSVRKIGNIGAHMEKDVNTIININKDEAQSIICLIEYLFDYTYINRNKTEELLKTVNEISKDKQEQRNKNT